MEKKIQVQYLDTDSVVLCVYTKDLMKDSKNLNDLFNFSNLVENQDLFGNIDKKMIGKIIKDSPKNIWIDEFIC